MQELKDAVKKACRKLFDIDIEPELNRTDEQFGDYSTNVALQLAAKLGKNPRDIATSLAEEIDGAQVAGPGFINFQLPDKELVRMAEGATKWLKKNEGKEMLAEFGDPNPFKEMHIGHLYSYIVGDVISRLLESSGATVRRLSYHGDVGLQVAKAIWGIKEAGVDTSEKVEDIGQYYAAGAKAYEKDEKTKAEIDEINQHIYQKDDEQINQLYEWGRQASFAYFDEVLEQINVKTERRYLESESAEAGTEFVQEHVGKVFEQSEGAIVYKGEKVGLHTRVFITSKGLPTYEAKDLGLAELKNQDYPNAERSIIITAHEQAEYFRVMLAALREFDPSSADKTTHISHGFLSLSTGKMSSRTGDVYSAVDLLKDVEKAAKKLYPKSEPSIYVGAVKYGFLRHRVGADIIYDVQESVGLEGNSGPYIQYALVRANSILAKAGDTSPAEVTQLDASERSLVRKISEYPEIVERAIDELMPHHICTYLYELAQTFNSFYEKSRIIGDERQGVRLKMVRSYAQVLKNGLGLLNIEAPEKM